MLDGERSDIVARLAAAPGWLRDAVAVLPAPANASLPPANNWGVADIIRHVRAADAIIATRIFQVLVREAALLPAFDERAWGQLYVAAAMPLDDQLAHFALRRAELAAVLRSLTPEQWSRAGQHEVAGNVTIIDLCRTIADHESEHRIQLSAIVAGEP